MTISDESEDQSSRSGSHDDGTPRTSSHELLRGQRRLIIEHAGEEYCLQITRNKRLILTKR